MPENNSNGRPPTQSLDELVDYFDTHDMGEYWEKMPEVHFDIDIKRRTHLVAIKEKLISGLKEIAESRHVSTEVLINSWLEEKLAQTG